MVSAAAEQAAAAAVPAYMQLQQRGGKMVRPSIKGESDSDDSDDVGLSG